MWIPESDKKHLKKFKRRINRNTEYNNGDADNSSYILNDKNTG